MKYIMQTGREYTEEQFKQWVEDFYAEASACIPKYHRPENHFDHIVRVLKVQTKED